MSVLNVPARVVGGKLSKSFTFGRDVFVFGVEDETYLNSLVMYRVSGDGSISPSFWLEVHNREGDSVEALMKFFDTAIAHFTDYIVARFLDNDDLDDKPTEETIYTILADALSTLKWNESTEVLYRGE